MAVDPRRSSALLLALPAVLLGIATMKALFADVNEAALFTSGCPDVVSYSFRFGHQRLDRFLCAMVQFFKLPLRSLEGTWIVGYVLSTASAAFTFMGVEASRQHSSLVLSITPVYAFLFQTMGISVVVPLLWLPVYFFSRSSHTSALQAQVSPYRVAAIKLLVLVMELIIIAMLLPFHSSNKDLLYLVFQPAPVLLSALWLLCSPVPRSESEAELGHKLVILAHALGAGAGLVWHFVALLMLAGEPSIWSRVVELPLHHPGHLWCNFFLLLDFLVLFLAFVYLSAAEDGLRAAVVVTLAGFVVGPAAALSLYFVYREHRFLKLKQR